MCGAHATVRGFLGELVAKSPDAFDVVVDMEAGLEHFSRGTGKHVSRFLAVVEPYYRSMETARSVADLAAELGIARSARSSTRCVTKRTAKPLRHSARPTT